VVIEVVEVMKVMMRKFSAMMEDIGPLYRQHDDSAKCSIGVCRCIILVSMASCSPAIATHRFTIWIRRRSLPKQ
jgi:hypothetical protein